MVRGAEEQMLEAGEANRQDTTVQGAQGHAEPLQVPHEHRKFQWLRLQVELQQILQGLHNGHVRLSWREMLLRESAGLRPRVREIGGEHDGMAEERLLHDEQREAAELQQDREEPRRHGTDREAAEAEDEEAEGPEAHAYRINLGRVPY